MTVALPHTLDRSLVIHATPETVFRFFTDEGRWASWWGKASTIDARLGGRVVILYPDGTEVTGEVLELVSPRRIVFTYGYTNGKLVAPGGSRVTIQLDPDAQGTRLRLTHEFADAAARDHHVQGWRYQLSLFSNIVANELNAGAAAAVDEWFVAWAVTDEKEREQLLARIASASVQFRDRFSCVDGISDLMPHITASQHFMPGLRLERRGSVRHCQGYVLADWTTTATGAMPQMAGTNLFVFDAHGRIASVTGFWQS